MIGICTCEGNINNLGKPGCLVELQAPEQLWFALRKKQDGSSNCIDPTATLDLAEMNTFLQATDALERYLPLKGVKNFTPEQADDTTDEASDGSIEIVNQGIVSSTYTVWCKDPYKLKAKMDTLRCLELMVYTVDRAGNVIGQLDSATEFCGRKVAVNTMSTKVLPKNDEGNNKVEISFSYERGSGDDKVDYIQSTDFASDFDPLDVIPLQDVNMEFVGSPAQTTATFKLFLDYGSVKTRIAVGGLDETNLQLRNNTDTTDVPFITCSDAATTGTYISTYALQDVSDLVAPKGITTVQSGFDLKRIDDVFTAVV